MASTNTKVKINQAFDHLKESLGLANKMQSPKLKKVVVSVGVGSISDSQKRELIPERLARITGQKASPRPAKKSVAAFRTRQGDIIGYQVTLRGEQMYGFVDKLINIVLPRTKDFRGIKRTSIDESNNLTIGIKEHTIFPETADEDIRNIFGMAVTLVTNTTDKNQAERFFEYLGIPFQTKEEKQAKK